MTRHTVISDVYEGLRREGYTVEAACNGLALLGVQPYELPAAVLASEFAALPPKLRLVRPDFEEALQKTTTQDAPDLLRELEAADLIIEQLAGALREYHIELAVTLRRGKRTDAIARAKG